jgi:hypothetical protein
MRTCGQVFCARCKKELAPGTEEYCWFCDSALCFECWDLKGHCGHPEADVINNASNLTDIEGRAKICKALWPDAECLVPIKKKDEKKS